jgi:hypothetical protein
MKKMLLLIFLMVSSSAFSKDKDLQNYPIRFSVRSLFATDCEMGLTGGGHYYVIFSEAPNCVTFTPGATVAGRLGTTWGIRWIELAWKNKKGEVKACKYTINSDLLD